ncbi:MAG: lipopolysaccharide kinase InaA family protein [Phycisphaerae bacterium]
MKLRTDDPVLAPTIAIRSDGASHTLPSSDDGPGSVLETWSGHSWQCLPSAAIALKQLPCAAWQDPKAAGWICVKRNARRDVWQATIGGQKYFVKYFFADGRLREIRNRFFRAPWDSEWESGVYAAKHGIPAVSPVAMTTNLIRSGGTCAVLVTHAVEPSQPLNVFWSALQADPDLRRRREDANQILERLAQLIARAHQAGFEHTDMHAANILVQPVAARRYRCVFVDLQSAKLGSPISDNAVVRNLAQLNQWFRKNSPISDRIRFLRAYFRARNDLETAFPNARVLHFSFDQLIRELAWRADQHAQRLWNKRDRRILKNGRYFSAVKSEGWRGAAFLQTKQQMPESVASTLTLTRDWWETTALPFVERAFAEGAIESRKNSHSARVGKLDLPLPDGSAMQVIVKKPIPRNLRRALALAMPPSRSRRAWRTGNGLLHRDIPTARPLAFVEKRKGPFIHQELLIVEAHADATDLESFLRTEYARTSAAEWVQWKRAVSRLLEKLMRANEDRRVFHRDCKASNLLLVQAPTPKLLWIDLDGIRLRNRPLTDEEIIRPLVRLHVSLMGIPGVTRSDGVRFLKSYFSRYDLGPDEWRSILRKMIPMIEQKQIAAERRREWKQKKYNRT